jgi:multidrug resistance efflux pump
LTSQYARPDREPLEELERLLRAVEEELAGWRARAGKPVEAGMPKVRGSLGVADLSQARQRLALLEGENQLLHQRIAAAREQVEQLRTRLRFIEDRGTDAA